MTVSEIAIPSTAIAQRADLISQSTAVEQARAVADVQVAAIMAKQDPRNLTVVVQRMRDACRQSGLADRAFFKFPRAGGTVSGPSVHLARALAGCWGNISFEVKELRRDDTGAYSEMMAWAWDVETNTRSSQTFVVPHKRDKKGGPEVLTDMRDIYENNANNAARRLREVIFSVLPTWFTEEAKDLCARTLADGGGKTLPQTIADAVAKFEGIGIKTERLERKIGSPSNQWTAHDVAGLRVSFASLQQGTVTADEEFPPIRVTADEITQTGQARVNEQPAAPTPSRGDADKTPESPGGEPGVTPDTPARRLKPHEQVAADAAAHNVTDPDDQVKMAIDIIGREVASLTDLTGAEVKQIRDLLKGLGPGTPYVWGNDSFVSPAVKIVGEEAAAPPAAAASSPAWPTTVEGWLAACEAKGVTKNRAWLRAREMAQEVSGVKTPAQFDNIPDLPANVLGALWVWLDGIER